MTARPAATRFGKSCVSLRLAVVLLLGARRISGQGLAPSREGMRFEVRPYVGAFLPTGDRRNVLESAALGGLQMSLVVVPRMALTVTFGVAQSKDRMAFGDQSVDIIQTNIGAEWRLPARLRHSAWHFAPFLGAGLGSRTYEYRDAATSSQLASDNYGTLGAELVLGAWGVRVEGRDYVSTRKLSDVGTPRWRNDVAISVGVSVRLPPDRGGRETPHAVALQPSRAR